MNENQFKKNLKLLIMKIQNNQCFPLELLNKISDSQINIMYLQLLSLINSSTNQQNVKLVENILLIISGLVKLTKPAQYLIRFQYDKFEKYCINADYDILNRKSKGLYPQMRTQKEYIPLYIPFYLEMRKCKQPQLIGNRSWQIARLVLAQWYQVNCYSLNDQQDTCYRILLCNQNLLQKLKQIHKWNDIWFSLYQWYYNFTGNIYKKNKVQIQDLHIIIKREIKIYNNQFAKGLQFNIYYAMIALLDHDYDSLKKCYQFIKSQFKFTLENHLALFLLYRIGQSIKSLQIQKECKKLYLQQILRFAEETPYFEDFMPFYFIEEEIIDFFTQNSQIFPNYHFKQEIIEKIALNQIKQDPSKLMKFQNKISLESYIKQMLIDGSIANQDYYNFLQNKIQEQNPKQINILQGQNIFSEQLKLWGYYHEAINNRGIEKLYKLIMHTNKFQFQDKTIKSPLIQSACVYKIIKEYSLKLKKMNQQEAIFQKCLDIVIKDEFQKLVSFLDLQQRDQIWSIWGQILLKNVNLVSQLINLDKFMLMQMEN